VTAAELKASARVQRRNVTLVHDVTQ